MRARLTALLVLATVAVMALPAHGALPGNAIHLLRPWGLDAALAPHNGARFDVVLKVGARDRHGDVASPGNFYALSFDVPGIDAYRDDILFGNASNFGIATAVESQPGNVGAATREALEMLFATQSVFGEYVTVVVPVVNWQQVGGGRRTVQILAFVRVRITGFTRDEVFADILEFVNPGEPGPD